MTSHIKRTRASKDAMTDRDDRLLEIVFAAKPMTVRQVFYQATVHGIVEKAETGYNKVQTALVRLRRNGRLPYEYLADSTRWERKPTTYDDIEEALRNTAYFYRKSLWRDVDAYVEVWIEKDALAGVVYPVTSEYDVPLMVSRGYSSLSFLHSAGNYIAELDVPVYIYHLGDFDPSGVNAAEKIEQGLREFAPDADIHFEQLAVLPSQIKVWKLPTRPTKKTDTRAKGFGDISVELDAIEADMLRLLVREAIERHLPRHELETLMVAEVSERQLLQSLVNAGIRSATTS